MDSKKKTFNKWKIFKADSEGFPIIIEPLCMNSSIGAKRRCKDCGKELRAKWNRSVRCRKCQGKLLGSLPKRYHIQPNHPCPTCHSIWVSSCGIKWNCKKCGRYWVKNPKTHIHPPRGKYKK